MTADELAFRRAICWNVADNLPRLVYADWLEEKAGLVACGVCFGDGIDNNDPQPCVDCREGSKCETCDGSYTVFPVCLKCDGSGSISNGLEVRAKFIRLAVNNDGKFVADSQADLATLYRHLLGNDGTKWLEDDNKFGIRLTPKNVPYARFWKRGFVSRVRCSIADWERDGAGVVAVHPIEYVEFTGAVFNAPVVSAESIREARMKAGLPV